LTACLLTIPSSISITSACCELFKAWMQHRKDKAPAGPKQFRQRSHERRQLCHVEQRHVTKRRVEPALTRARSAASSVAFRIKYWIRSVCGCERTRARAIMSSASQKRRPPRPWPPAGARRGRYHRRWRARARPSASRAIAQSGPDENLDKLIAILHAFIPEGSVLVPHLADLLIDLLEVVGRHACVIVRLNEVECKGRVRSTFRDTIREAKSLWKAEL